MIRSCSALVALAACKQDPAQPPAPPPPPPAPAPRPIVVDAPLPPQPRCWTGISVRTGKSTPEPQGSSLDASGVILSGTCPGPSRNTPAGFWSFSSVSEFFRTFHCNPGVSVDAAHRLVIIRYTHLSSDTVSFKRAIDTGGRIALVLDYESACQGVDPGEEQTSFGVLLPKQVAPIDVITCEPPHPPCPPGIP